MRLVSALVVSLVFGLLPLNLSAQPSEPLVIPPIPLSKEAQAQQKVIGWFNDFYQLQSLPLALKYELEHVKENAELLSALAELLEDENFALPPRGFHRFALRVFRKTSVHVTPICWAPPKSTNTVPVFSEAILPPPETEIVPFIVGSMLGEQPPMPLSVIQQQLQEAAKGKKGKPAIAAMLKESTRLLSKKTKEIDRQTSEAEKKLLAAKKQFERILKILEEKE